MMRRAHSIRVAVRINTNPLAQVESLLQVHSHVKQRSVQGVVGCRGDEVLSVEAKPVLLKHGACGGPNGVVVVLRCEELAEVKPAPQPPVLRYPSHHDSGGTKGGTVVEASWIRSVCAGFAFDEYRSTVPPVHPNVAKVVG